MGTKYGGRGGPCYRGHPAERRGRSGCRDCNAARKRATQKAIGAYAYKKKYNPNWKLNEHWIAKAHRSLCKRVRCQPRAKIGELRAQWGRQNGRCGLTGISLDGVKPHLDHKVPLAAGGDSRIENLHWVHPMANNAKNQHSTEEFQRWLLASADALRAKIALESLL